LAQSVNYMPWGAVSHLVNGFAGSGANAQEIYQYNNRQGDHDHHPEQRETPGAIGALRVKSIGVQPDTGEWQKLKKLS
jgi:hypothetical protein